MTRKQTAHGYIIEFDGEYVLSYSEEADEFMLYHHNKPRKLGLMSNAAKLSTQQELALVAYLEKSSNPDLDELWEILWPAQDDADGADSREDDEGEDLHTNPIVWDSADNKWAVAGAAGAVMSVATFALGIVVARKRWH